MNPLEIAGAVCLNPALCGAVAIGILGGIVRGLYLRGYLNQNKYNKTEEILIGVEKKLYGPPRSGSSRGKKDRIIESLKEK